MEKPKIVVAAVIEKDGKYLLIKEKLSSGNEKWIVPGGKVEFGEKLEDAVKREIKEETNLDIEILEFLDFYEAVYPDYDYHTVIFFFHAIPINHDMKLEDHILESKFFTKDEINNHELVDSAQWLFENYL